jgi:hypothetical protein
MAGRHVVSQVTYQSNSDGPVSFLDGFTTGFGGQKTPRQGLGLDPSTVQLPPIEADAQPYKS